MTRCKSTRLGHAGRDPARQHGMVNPPVDHASTVVFPSVAALEEASRHPLDGVYYGRFGTPITFAFETAVAELEGGARSLAMPSGLAAIACALQAFVGAGDHVLVTDNVYQPTRKLCDSFLARFGVETTYFDPMIGGDGLRALMRPRTRVVFLESPGSLTFEVQDVPALAAAAHDGGAMAILDNTWSAGLFFEPFAHGVDVSVQAATKYIVGHSDAMLGTITTRNEVWETVKWTAIQLGICAGPDDCNLGLRGIRTLATRLDRHRETGLALAHWLAGRPEVARVLHPARPDSPGHETWARDFTGASGLFAVVLRPASAAAVAAMLDGLALFAMGYSWGGYESLILPVHPERARSATAWTAEGPCLRLHAGLEDPGDLIADLEAGLARLTAGR